MPWGRIDDTHYDHPKVMALPRAVRNAADGLYWRCISWSNAKLTDGYVAQTWLDVVMASESLRGTGMSHPLAMVLAAFDGETDPVRVGLSSEHHDAFRAALRAAPQATATAAPGARPIVTEAGRSHLRRHILAIEAQAVAIGFEEGQRVDSEAEGMAAAAYSDAQRQTGEPERDAD